MEIEEEKVNKINSDNGDVYSKKEMEETISVRRTKYNLERFIQIHRSS